MGPDDTAVNEHRCNSIVIIEKGWPVRYQSSPQIIKNECYYTECAEPRSIFVKTSASL